MAGEQDLDTRVARLEEGLITLTRDVGTVSRNVEAISQRLGTLGRPDLSVVISGAFLIMALFSAGMIPVYQRAGYALDTANEVKGWQEAYMRGQIPSSAEGKIGAIETKFAEIETQFHGDQRTIEANERYTKERADTNHADIQANHAEITELRRTQQEQAALLTRLDERSHQR